MDKANHTRKKAIGSIVMIAVLFLMLVVTTYALIASFVSVDDNAFETGTVQIELNGGKTVFDGSDMNVEPGHSLVRDFTVKNTGSADIHYRLYLENVEGALQEVLTFSVYDGEKLLYSGKAKDFSKQTPCVSDTPMSAGETRALTVVVKMDESAGDTYQAAGITFDITAEAVQAKNNPDKAFE